MANTLSGELKLQGLHGCAERAEKLESDNVKMLAFIKDVHSNESTIVGDMAGELIKELEGPS